MNDVQANGGIDDINARYNTNCKIPVSPLVYSPEELEERLRIGDDFIKEIIQKGTILYERASS